ncbi:hypothetical protein B0A54_09779 [Friedmanniomyces endolithicus]|uniref:Diphthamide biosynthesis protein 3 n=2 Tax=Friedmanniomyces endolithicus TaxID=329885 RepID=A0A4U0UPT2_9PEZI|nr:hypothetical protein B0A54_09779 [Friedmanniomyces endolithicus]
MSLNWEARVTKLLYRKPHLRQRAFLGRNPATMATNENIYDEIEIEDMTYDAKLQLYHYPCPCGDRFEITLDDLREGETDIGICPSCSLQIRIIYEIEDLPRPEVEAEGQKVPGMVMSEQQVTALAAAT